MSENSQNSIPLPRGLIIGSTFVLQNFDEPVSRSAWDPKETTHPGPAKVVVAQLVTLREGTLIEQSLYIADRALFNATKNISDLPTWHLRANTKSAREGFYFLTSDTPQKHDIKKFDDPKTEITGKIVDFNAVRVGRYVFDSATYKEIQTLSQSPTLNLALATEEEITWGGFCLPNQKGRMATIIEGIIPRSAYKVEVQPSRPQPVAGRFSRFLGAFGGLTS